MQGVQTLDLGDVVEGKVEPLQVREVLQVLDLGDHVVVQLKLHQVLQSHKVVYLQNVPEAADERVHLAKGNLLGLVLLCLNWPGYLHAGPDEVLLYHAGFYSLHHVVSVCPAFLLLLPVWPLNPLAPEGPGGGPSRAGRGARLQGSSENCLLALFSSRQHFTSIEVSMKLHTAGLVGHPPLPCRLSQREIRPNHAFSTLLGIPIGSSETVSKGQTHGQFFLFLLEIVSDGPVEKERLSRNAVKFGSLLPNKR